ncbi:hypothetical protein NQZ68_023132 [Dissostichus eleginoides]|nr:hypothetical protein NQZ68_023132 [Dissostichus eleginoides]
MWPRHELLPLSVIDAELSGPVLSSGVSPPLQFSVPVSVTCQASLRLLLASRVAMETSGVREEQHLWGLGPQAVSVSGDPLGDSSPVESTHSVEAFNLLPPSCSFLLPLSKAPLSIWTCSISTAPFSGLPYQ